MKTIEQLEKLLELTREIEEKKVNIKELKNKENDIVFKREILEDLVYDLEKRLKGNIEMLKQPYQGGKLIPVDTSELGKARKAAKGGFFNK